MTQTNADVPDITNELTELLEFDVDCALQSVRVYSFNVLSPPSIL